MKIVHIVALVILVLGGLNVGLSAFGIDVIALALGAGGTAEYIARILIGVSAILLAVTHKASCKICMTSAAPMA